jgi:hypothetical protein
VAQQRPLAGPVRVRGVTPNVHPTAGEKALISGLASQNARDHNPRVRPAGSRDFALAVWPQPPPDNWCPSVPVRAVRSEARQRCIAAAARGGAAGYGPLLLGLVAAD